MQVEVIEIDKKKYFVLSKADYKNNTYLFLSNIKDEEDNLIRKVDNSDSSYLVPLTEDEYINVIKLFDFDEE